MRELTNVALADYTSLHVGGPAQRLIEVGADDDLKTLVGQQTMPLWLLGDGTNSLVADSGLGGTVIVCKQGVIETVAPNQLRASCGANWDDLTKKAVELGLYGLEFTSGVPGTVGGAVVGNIAAYGHQVADHLVSATILNPKNGQVSTWNAEQFGFSYRHSNLEDSANQHLVLLDATFEFSKTPTGPLEYGSALKVAEELGIEPGSLENRRRIILESRRRAGALNDSSTTNVYTAGSFFKNPVVGSNQVEAIIAQDESGISRQQLLRQNQIHGGSTVRVSAAHVLLAAGFRRGQSWGNVGLHPDHVLKIANLGAASAQEIYDVIQMIIKTVQQKLGITLEPEVRFLGDFS